MSFLGWGADVLPGEPPRDGIGGSLRTRDRGCRRQLRPAVVCSVGSWPRRCVCRRVEPVERLLDVLTRGRVRFVSRAIRHLHHVGLGPLDALGALERESRLLRRVLRRFARFSRVDDVVPPGSLGTRLHAIARGGRGRHVGSTRLEARVPWFTAKRARGRARRARGVARGKRRREFRFEKFCTEYVAYTRKSARARDAIGGFPISRAGTEPGVTDREPGNDTLQILSFEKKSTLCWALFVTGGRASRSG